MAYYAVFTTLGLTRLAEAQASEEPLVFTHVAVGDGGGSPITPDASMTELVNETARVAVNSVSIEPSQPNVVRVEGLFPAETGGFTIREAGLFNGAGEMIAVASYPDIYKPELSDGAIVDEYIRILLHYEAVEAVALYVDPAVIMATRDYVDRKDQLLDGRIESLEEKALHFHLGDGSDGAVDLDGVNTYDFASKSGSIYTLTRSPMATDFRIRSGVTLERSNFPVHCTGTYQNDEGAVDECDGADGGDASGTTPGTAGDGANGGVFLNAGNGGIGGYDESGDDGDDVVDSVGGAGGRGGTINAGYPNGIGGSVTAPTATLGATRTFRAIMEGYLFGQSGDTATITGLRGGAGGAGGAGAAAFTVAGGGGGGGGGISATACKRAEVHGTLRANGGAGGDGSLNVTTRAGGGGGGGGGRVGLACGELVQTGTIEAEGGAPGLAANPTAAGDLALAGDEGEVVIIEASSMADQPHIEEGKAIFEDTDTVVVTFSDDWEYENAIGLDGYELLVGAPIAYDYGGISVQVIAKHVGGFTLLASGAWNGEVPWKTKGY